MVETILWLRQQYHFGPQKIAVYLRRCHDLTISSSGGGILHKVHLGRLRAPDGFKLMSQNVSGRISLNENGS